MSLSVKFTVGSRSQDFRITRLKWGFSLSRHSNQSIREVWFSFSREPMRSTQDDYRTRTSYYTLHTGNTYQRFQLVLPDCFYDYEAEQDRMYAADHDVSRDGNVQSFTPPF